jgi:hypothetical protein
MRELDSETHHPSTRKKINFETKEKILYSLEIFIKIFIRIMCIVEPMHQDICRYLDKQKT